MMRYYKKEHTIKLTLTNLFPKPVEDGLADEIRDYYRSKGLNYDDVMAAQEVEDALKFRRHQQLLLKYVPEDLKPLVENNRLYPVKNLSDDSIRAIKRWIVSVFKEAEQAFAAYNEYLEQIRHQLTDGFQKLVDMYIHDSKILDYSIDEAKLTMEIRDVEDQRYMLEFTGLRAYNSAFNMKSNVWKQCEVFVNKDGSIELSILSDEAGDRPIIESINEINIVASDVKITALSG